ncbi:MAG: HNH endonuclease signature motif containing protein [Candidatus Gracilibacteria bacterium]|jgi:hypothetical protein
MKKLSPKIITLHAQFSRYGRNAREWMRKCVLLLPEIERNRVWEKKGFSSIYEYAAKLAGMSRETVNEGLRVLRKIEDKPELMRVVKQKGLLAVKPVVAIATVEDAKFWASKAMNMSRHTLETYVKELKNQNGLFEPQNSAGGRSGTAKNTNFPQQEAIEILVDKDVAEQLKKLKGSGDWNELMKQFLELRNNEVMRLKKEAEQKFEEIEAKKRQSCVGAKVLTKPKSTRSVPSKIQKYSFYKTNHTCAFPGCTKPAETLHHTDRFAITRKHEPDKIIPLCKAHHDLVHNGLIENENAEPAEWRIMRVDNEHGPNINNYKSVIDQQVAEYRRL